MHVTLIGLFGVLGVLLRFFIGEFFKPTDSIFNATFLVNILGCFIIGLCFKGVTNYDVNFDTSKMLLSAIAIGFCGGLTTFSSFTLDAFRFIQSNNFVGLFTYAIATLILGLLALILGFKLSL